MLNNHKIMSTPSLRNILGLVFFQLFVASTANAHPGHDGGHDLTWDFETMIDHIVTNPDHLLPLLTLAVLSIFCLCNFFRNKPSDNIPPRAKSSND